MNTFNHEKYIAECLQGLVEQETTFPFEILVSDDKSSDSTPDIVRDFAQRYPDKVRPILFASHVGASRSSVTGHALARGEYVAHMDGDDLAFPGKLATQARYLDEHPECVVCWHRTETFNDDRSITFRGYDSLEEVVDTNRITLGDLLRYGTMGGSSTLMYRRSAERDFATLPAEMIDFFFATFLLSGGGYGANLNELLGGYRHNKGTLTESSRYGRISPMKVHMANHLKFFLDRMPNHKKDIFVNSIARFAVDAKHLEPTALMFLNIALRSFSPFEIPKLPRHFSDILKLRMSPK